MITEFRNKITFESNEITSTKKRCNRGLLLLMAAIEQCSLKLPQGTTADYQA
jgi:hypothetical protein